MSDRGRVHNIGQALFESLGAGLGAYGNFLQQETERKSASQQQSFLNRLNLEAGARAQVGLEQGQERLILAQKGFDFEQQKFERQQEIDPIEQSQIDLRGAQQSAAEALATQRGVSGEKVTAGTFNTIFGELGLGFKQRELTRQLEAQNPAFGTITQERKPEGFFGSLNPFNNEYTDVFKPRRDIDLGEISIPPDTLTALLQQARQIAGGSQLTPSTDLSNLGGDSVFPPAHDLDLAEAEGLARQWAETGGISDWANLPETTRRQIIEKLLSEGIPGANR